MHRGVDAQPSSAFGTFSRTREKDLGRLVPIEILRPSARGDGAEGG
jgi:hypothetical protein